MSLARTMGCSPACLVKRIASSIETAVEAQSFYDRLMALHAEGPAGKTFAVALEIGRIPAEARGSLGPIAYSNLRGRPPFLRHEFHPERVVVDKDRRLSRLARIKALTRYRDQVPNVGWAFWRQLSPLAKGGDESLLELLFQRRLINRSMSGRESLDALRSLMRGRPIAPRHRRRSG
jgi:hypothetical protein